VIADDVTRGRTRGGTLFARENSDCHPERSD